MVSNGHAAPPPPLELLFYILCWSLGVDSSLCVAMRDLLAWVPSMTLRGGDSENNVVTVWGIGNVGREKEHCFVDVLALTYIPALHLEGAFDS